MKEGPVLVAASEGDSGFSESKAKIVNTRLVKGISSRGELEVFDGAWEDIAAGMKLKG